MNEANFSPFFFYIVGFVIKLLFSGDLGTDEDTEFLNRLKWAGKISQ